MAEPRKKTTEGSVKRENRWKEAATQLGMLVLTGIVSGASLAAGGHVYHAVARNLGGQPGGNVLPMRKIG